MGEQLITIKEQQKNSHTEKQMQGYHLYLVLQYSHVELFISRSLIKTSLKYNWFGDYRTINAKHMGFCSFCLYHNLTDLPVVIYIWNLRYIYYNSVASFHTVAFVVTSNMCAWHEEVASDAHRLRAFTVATIVNAGNHHPRQRATIQSLSKDMDIWN